MGGAARLKPKPSIIEAKRAAAMDSPTDAGMVQPYLGSTMAGTSLAGLASLAMASPPNLGLSRQDGPAQPSPVTPHRRDGPAALAKAAGETWEIARTKLSISGSINRGYLPNMPYGNSGLGPGDIAKGAEHRANQAFQCCSGKRKLLDENQPRGELP
jgi:hypothetical protein